MTRHGLTSDRRAAHAHLGAPPSSFRRCGLGREAASDHPELPGSLMEENRRLGRAPRFSLLGGHRLLFAGRTHGAKQWRLALHHAEHRTRIPTLAQDISIATQFSAYNTRLPTTTPYLNTTAGLTCRGGKTLNGTQHPPFRTALYGHIGRCGTTTWTFWNLHTAKDTAPEGVLLTSWSTCTILLYSCSACYVSLFYI